MAEQDYDVVDLRPAIGAIFRGWFKIGLASIVGAGLAVGYTYVIKPVHGASTVLLMPIQEATAFNPLAAFAGVTDPIEILKGIVESRAAREYVAKRTNLSKREIEEMVSVTPRKAQNQMAITTESENRDLALKVTKYSLEALSTLSATTNISLAQRQADLTEKAVDEKQKELQQAEDELIAFQKGTVTVPDPLTPFTGSAYMQRFRDVSMELKKVEQQLSVARKEAARRAEPAAEIPSGLPESERWRTRLVELEYQLRLAENQYGPQAPQVVKLKKDIDVTREQLQQAVQDYMASIRANIDPGIAQLEAQRLLLQWQKDYLDRMADAAPDEAVKFQRLLREVTSRTEVLKLVRARYENAKLDAEVDRVRWSVLVAPYLEEQPVNKKYVRNAAIGWFLAVLLSTFVIGRRHARKQSLSDAMGR